MIDLTQLSLSPSAVMLMGVAFFFAFGQMLIGKEKVGTKATDTLIDMARAAEGRLKLAEDSILNLKVELIDKGRRITDLQNQVAALMAQSREKDEQIARLEGEVKARDMRIEKLEAQVKALQSR